VPLSLPDQFPIGTGYLAAELLALVIGIEQRVAVTDQSVTGNAHLQ